MLNRRDFLKTSGLLAAGTVLSLTSAAQVMDWVDPLPTARPIMRLSGHARSGCAYRPELVDLWAGGGSQLPDML